MKPRHFHSKRQILPFDIRRTDLAVIWDAQDFCNLCTRDLRRSIAAWSRIGRGIKLRDLCISGTIAEVPHGRQG